MPKLIRYLLTLVKPYSQEANFKIRRHGNLECFTKITPMSSTILANKILLKSTIQTIWTFYCIASTYTTLVYVVCIYLFNT